MLKVEHKDLEEITKFLDKISRISLITSSFGLKLEKDGKYAKHLSQKIKDKYTEIKPDYDRTN